jgi:hypothetical protein
MSVLKSTNTVIKAENEIGIEKSIVIGSQGVPKKRNYPK